MRRSKARVLSLELCACTCVCMSACVCVCVCRGTQVKVGGQTPLWSHFSPSTSVWLPGTEPRFLGFQQMRFPSEPSHWPRPLWHAGRLTVSSELCSIHLLSSSDPILRGADGLQASCWKHPCGRFLCSRPREVGDLFNGCKCHRSLGNSQPDGRG